MRSTRRLDLEGAYNVRDLGGYETMDGGRTRWRTFLRADSLHRLTPAAQERLVSYGVHSVIDLRRSDEAKAEPNVFDGSPEVEYRWRNMTGDSFVDPYRDRDSPPRFEQYKNILDKRIAQIGETIALLAAPASGTTLFHCAGGQDRTGMIAALLLGVAGVPPQTIAEDYTLTAQYYVDLFLGKDAPPDVNPADYTVEAYRRRQCPPEAMLRTVEYLAHRYGSVEGYVRAAGVSGLEIERLRAALVE